MMEDPVPPEPVWLLASAGMPSPGHLTLELAGIAVLLLLRLVLSLMVAALPAVSPVFLSRRLPAERAARWLDHFSGERVALRLARDLGLLGAACWGVSLATRASLSHPGVLVFSLAAVGGVLAGEGLLGSLLARRAPETVLTMGLPLMGFVAASLRPVAGPLAGLLRSTRRPEPGNNGAKDEEEREEELQAYIGVGEARGILDGEEGELVQQIVTFGDTIVREVMTPRTEMVALPHDATLDEARSRFVESRHSRLPVYRGTLDEVVGVISVRDLLSSYPAGANPPPITELMRPVHLVPGTRKVAELLRDLQHQRMPLAVVVDEYGGTAGLVTIEDLLEEIVGEIKDEHEEEAIVHVPDGGWLVSGLCSVEELEDVVDRDLAREGVDSVGGLVFSTLGRLPELGEAVCLDDLELRVVELDDRRIARIHARLLPASVGEDP